MKRLRLPSGRQVTATLRAEAEQLCRRLAAGDRTGPVYVLNKSELPAKLRGLTVLGFTAPVLDAVLRPTIGEERWVGPGPCIVIDDEWLWHYVGTGWRGVSRDVHRPTRRREMAREMYLGTVLHELAHVAAADFFDDYPKDDEFRAAAAKQHARDISADAPSPSGAAATVPFNRHEWPFLRMALHLCHRAEARGVFVGWPDVIDHASYSLSPPWRYARALGGEAQRMADFPLADVGMLIPPAEFIAVWNEDVEAWLRSADRPKSAVEQLVRRAMQIGAKYSYRENELPADSVAACCRRRGRLGGGNETDAGGEPAKGPKV